MKLHSKKTAAGKSIAWIFSAVLLFVCFGCEPPAPVNNTTVTTANANTSAPVNAAPVNSSNVAVVPNKESQARMPVTLPVLDAMFTEGDFVGELKSKAQLSDEQIQNLKKLSREAVGNLDEGKSGESSGSTRVAMERADKEIRAMLGEEKASKLFDVVRQRWAQGIDEADNSSGNSSGNSFSIMNSAFRQPCIFACTWRNVLVFTYRRSICIFVRLIISATMVFSLESGYSRPISRGWDFENKAIAGGLGS